MLFEINRVVTYVSARKSARMCLCLYMAHVRGLVICMHTYTYLYIIFYSLVICPLHAHQLQLPWQEKDRLSLLTRYVRCQSYLSVLTKYGGRMCNTIAIYFADCRISCELISCILRVKRNLNLFQCNLQSKCGLL